MARPVAARLSPALLLALPLGLAVLSGCFSNSSVPELEASPAPVAAAEARFDESTGAVDGLVRDDELQGLAGAKVQIRELEVLTTSAEDGRFSFSFVPPGRYTLEAQKLGFEQTTLSIRIEPGQVLQARLELQPIPVVKVYRSVSMWNGHVTCSVGFSAGTYPVAGNLGFFSEECGHGVQNPATREVIGRNPNNKIDWGWLLTKDADVLNLRTILIELDWTPASAAAQQLALHVAHDFVCTPGCTGSPTYCDVFSNYGKAPVRCQIDNGTLGVKKESQLPWRMTARVWAAPSLPPNVVLEQDFTMYRTYFYGDPMPQGYTAIPAE